MPPLLQIGPVKVGSEHPIALQTMTTTDTRDVEKTVEQVGAGLFPCLWPAFPWSMCREDGGAGGCWAAACSPLAAACCFWWNLC